jgi:hypothetical protein
MHCVCFRKPNDLEWSSLKKNEAHHALKLYVFNVELHTWFLDLDVDVTLVPVPNHRAMKLRLHETMHEYAHTLSASGNSVLDRLCVNESFYPWYLVRRQLNGATIDTYEEYEWTQQVISKLENDAEVLVYANSQLTAKFFDRKVKVFGSQLGSEGAIRGLSSILHYFGILIFRALLGLIKSPRKAQNLYLYGSFLDQKLFQVDGKKLIKGDPIFQYFHDEVGKQDDFTTVSVFKNFGLKKYPKASLWSRGPRFASHHLFFERYMIQAFLNSEARRRISSFRRTVGKNRQEQYENPFYQFLNNRLNAQKWQLVLAVVRFEAGLLMMDHLRPKTVGGDSEWTFAKYPILMAAKAKKIPTYAIQHGIISHQNIDYNFHESDVSNKPFVDKTLVWGQGAQNRLSSDSVYPQDSLVLTGQVRSDVIPALKKEKPTFLLPNWNKDQTIILFASQYLPRSQALRDRLISDVLKLQAEVENLRVIIKPHPRELSDLSPFKEIARQLGLKPEIVTGDLYGLISLSDVVITFYSTVGTEALYFEKELIVLDYDGVDGSGYIKKGVAHHCNSYDALKDCIHSHLSAGLEDKSLARQRYIDEILFSIDGNVRFRMLEKIRAMSEGGVQSNDNA